MKACSGACGIQEERARQQTLALAAIERAYPTSRWGAFRPSELGGAGLDVESCAGLAKRIAHVLPVRVFPMRAGPPDLGDFLYLLCGLHGPCLFELREGLCPSDAEVARAEETYIRIALSPLGRFAALQECAFDVERLGRDERLVTERPRYGVENHDTNLIVKGLMGLLRRQRIVLLDFAFLLQRLSDAEDETFAERWTTSPTLWSFLFDPAPPTTTRSTVV